MNKIVIICVAYSVLFIGGFYLLQVIYNDREIEIAQGRTIIDKIENRRSMEDNEEGNIESTHDEVEYGYDVELVKIFQDIENNLSFFVATLQDENITAFTSMFVPGQYSKDLWAYSDNPYKEKVNYQFMRELNRNGTLVAARYITKLMDGYKTNRPDSEVTLTLVYKDGKEAKLKLNFVLMGTEHSNKDDIYFIKNSVLTLINEVKHQTQ